MQVAAAADALLVYIPHPATPHMDLGASLTPHIYLALCCCCVVPWRRGAAAWALEARGMHSTGLYQQNYNGTRAICYAWLMFVDFLVFFVVNSCLFALPCRGGFALPCWGPNLGRGINEPANPQPPPQSRSPRRAELSWRVRNVSVRV